MASIRFLITGDLQIHPWRQFAYTTKSGMNSRLVNCLKVLKFCRQTAQERGIDKLLLNGDILEESDYINVETYDGLYTELERIHNAGIETVINLGNHDVYGESGGRVLHALRALRGVAKILEEPTLVWKAVQVVPWCSSVSKFRSQIQSLDASKQHCLVLHCGVQGAVTGPKNYLVRNPIKLEDIRWREFGLVLLSDYHTRQRLAKNPDVQYLGSPIQHSFGEIHRPCIWDICLDREGLFACNKVYSSFPRFRRVTATNSDKFYADTRRFVGDYVSVSIGKGGDVSEKEVQRIAKDIGFQVEIRRAGEEAELEIQDSKSLSFKQAMKKYVRSNVKSESKRGKLLRLGWRIFNGET